MSLLVVSSSVSSSRFWMLFLLDCKRWKWGYFDELFQWLWWIFSLVFFLEFYGYGWSLLENHSLQEFLWRIDFGIPLLNFYCNKRGPISLRRLGFYCFLHIDERDLNFNNLSSFRCWTTLSIMPLSISYFVR